MKIVGKQVFDKQGRIVITNLYLSGEIPDKVNLYIDSDTKMIVIEPYEEANVKYGNAGIQIDYKNRLCIPKWIIDEFNASGRKELLLIIDGDKRYLSPKTENLL